MRESSLESLLLLATLFVIHEKHAKALILLEGLHDVAPRDERVLRLLAHSLVMEGRHEQALKTIQELLTASGGKLRGEDMACALRLKASALWNLGRKEESRAILEQSVAYLPASSVETAIEKPAKRASFFSKKPL